MSRPTLVFAAGFLAGAGIAAAVVSTTGHGAAPPADDAVIRRLDAIESQVRFLGTSIADKPAVSFSEARSDVAPTPLADTRFDDILARLDALQALVSRAPSAEEVAQGDVPAAAPLRTVEPIPEKLPDAPPNLAAFGALAGRGMDELTTQHQLWTYEQVGEMYGRPLRVKPSPNGVGIKYYYELADGRSFIFWFTDGKCIGAWWND